MWCALGTPTPAGCRWVLLWASPRHVRHHGAPMWPPGAANSRQQRVGAGPGPALLAGATSDAGARVLARCSVPSSSHNSPFPTNRETRDKTRTSHGHDDTTESCYSKHFPETLTPLPEACADSSPETPNTSVTDCYLVRAEEASSGAAKASGVPNLAADVPRP